MTDLTRRQHAELNRDLVILGDAADVIVAMVEATRAAHHAAALLSTGDSPPSSWGDGSSRSVGDRSDPTGVAVLADRPRTDDLAALRRALAAFRDAGYTAHDHARAIAAKLNRGDGTAKRRTDDELHDANVGRGTCTACDRWCDGQGTNRLRTVRAAGALRTDVELRMCPACYVAWRRAVDADVTADIWVWCDMRRRHIERTTAAP